MAAAESSTGATTPKRRRSKTLWILLFACLGLLAGLARYAAVPRIYRASTAVMIVPQRLPQAFVRSTIETPLAERLDTIARLILSRTRLERIIQEFNLYEREREQLIMEDVVEQMRNDIHLMVSADQNRTDRAATFSVSFDAPDPRAAMRVTERLGSLFVQENLEDRQLLADQTEIFLQAQLEETSRRLAVSDGAIADARARSAPVARSLLLQNEVIQEQYKDLLLKEEQAKLAQQMERRQIGEQFKIIDGARLPERPIAPTLAPYMVWGTLAGAGVGAVGLALASLWRRRRARRAAAAAA